jgi:hypothetical protein
MPFAAAHYDEICMALARDPHDFGFYISCFYSARRSGYAELGS